MGDDDEAKERRAKDLEVGFYEDQPRCVDHKYELDRLFREWHSAQDDKSALMKGRGIIAELFRVLPKDREEEALGIIEDGKRNIKVNVERRMEGTSNEHYFVTYDTVPMYLRPSEFAVGMEHIWNQALSEKLDGQMITIARLRRLADEAGITQLDYRVGLTPGERTKRGAGIER